MLLLDEPTAGLAASVVRDLIDILKAIRGRRIPILLVEQNIGLAAAVADDCIVMTTGSAVWRGPMLAASESEEIRGRYFGASIKSEGDRP
jgi:branched-chain amino acid transport system ATP-binding protein